MTANLTFCFKGSRDYVQGPDIVSALFKHFSHEKISDIDLKFSGITKTNLIICTGSEHTDAKVNIHWRESGEEKYYQLVENNQPIECRYEYDENAIIRETNLDIDTQSISLTAITPFTLCENLVAMNKYLLQSLYPKEKGKWYFTRLQQDRIIDDNSLIQIKLIKNFNFRLTKSDILLNNEVIGSVYFSMVRG